MNFVPCLNTVMCEGCAAEIFREELHADHAGLCVACGDDLAKALAVEESEALLSDDEIVEALLESA